MLYSGCKKFNLQLFNYIGICKHNRTMDKKKKSSRKSPRAPKIKDLDVQQRKLAIIKQKQCDTIALHIVRKLIDSPVEEDVFIQSLKYLNQCHYQDIVEERALTKLCGYPICGNIIQNMPAKKFHISTKRNKIYDITERKNYCSNFCYKAGVYIKDQMLSSPLWFRDKEDIPEFRLLPKTETGIPGQEIDQGILKLDVDEDQKFTSISEFTQDMVNEIPENIQIDVDHSIPVVSEDTKHTENWKKDENKDLECGTQNQSFSNLFMPSLADILIENAAYFQNESVNSKIIVNKLDVNDKSVIIEKENNKVNEPKIGFNRTVINIKPNYVQKTKGILKKSKTQTKKKRVSFFSKNSSPELEQLSVEIDSTDKTFKKSETEPNEKTGSRFINKNVIGTVQERCTIFKNQTNNSENDEIRKNNDSIMNDVTNSRETRRNHLKNSSIYKKVHRISKASVHSPNSFQSSIDLTSKLGKSLTEWFTFETVLFLYGEEQVKQMISEKCFKHYLNKKKNLELDDNKQKQYEEICKSLRLVELADEKYDENVTGKKRRRLPRYEDLREAAEHQDLRVQAFYSSCYEEDLEDEDMDSESMEDKTSRAPSTPAVLPLMDNKDLLATRRKIFLTCVSRAIPVICEILEESPNNLLSEIKHLINTFDLSASNIVFKSSEWQLVTVLLIQILSVQDKDLQMTLAKEQVALFLSSLEKQFRLPDKYLENILSKVHVQNLLDECMRKDCIK